MNSGKRKVVAATMLTALTMLASVGVGSVPAAATSNDGPESRAVSKASTPMSV